MNRDSGELAKGREIPAYQTYYNYAEIWFCLLSTCLIASRGYGRALLTAEGSDRLQGVVLFADRSLCIRVRGML